MSIEDIIYNKIDAAVKRGLAKDFSDLSALVTARGVDFIRSRMTPNSDPIFRQYILIGLGASVERVLDESFAPYGASSARVRMNIKKLTSDAKPLVVPPADSADTVVRRSMLDGLEVDFPEGERQVGEAADDAIKDFAKRLARLIRAEGAERLGVGIEAGGHGWATVRKRFAGTPGVSNAVNKFADARANATGNKRTESVEASFVHHLTQALIADGQDAETARQTAAGLIRSGRGLGTPTPRVARVVLTKQGMDNSLALKHPDGRIVDLHDIRGMKFFIDGWVARGKLAPVRLLLHRLRTTGHAQEFRQLDSHYRDVSRMAPNRMLLPKKIHMYWAGKQPTPEALANIEAWAAKAASRGWVLHLWTDDTFQTWPNAIRMRLQERVRIHTDSEKLVAANGGPAVLEMYRHLKSIGVHNMVSDVVRYAMFSDAREGGGVYLDVDIAPGKADLQNLDTIAMHHRDVPVFAPEVRNMASVDRALNAAGLGTRVRDLDERTYWASQYLYEMGRLNTNVIVSPGGSVFARRALERSLSSYQYFMSEFQGNYGEGASRKFAHELGMMLKESAGNISGPGMIQESNYGPKNTPVLMARYAHEEFGVAALNDSGTADPSLVPEENTALFDPQLVDWISKLRLLTPESENTLDKPSSAPRRPLAHGVDVVNPGATPAHRFAGDAIDDVATADEVRRSQIRRGKRPEVVLPETVAGPVAGPVGGVTGFEEAVRREPALQGLRPADVARAFAIQERMDPSRALIGTDPETQAKRERRWRDLASITRVLVNSGQDAAVTRARELATGRNRPGLFGRGRGDEQSDASSSSRPARGTHTGPPQLPAVDGNGPEPGGPANDGAAGTSSHGFEYSDREPVVGTDVSSERSAMHSGSVSTADGGTGFVVTTPDDPHDGGIEPDHDDDALPQPAPTTTPQRNSTHKPQHDHGLEEETHTYTHPALGEWMSAADAVRMGITTIAQDAEAALLGLTRPEPLTPKQQPRPADPAPNRAGPYPAEASRRWPTKPAPAATSNLTSIPDGGEPPAPTHKPGRITHPAHTPHSTLLAEDLGERQRPRLDRDLASTPQSIGPVRLSDETQLPANMQAQQESSPSAQTPVTDEARRMDLAFRVWSREGLEDTLRTAGKGARSFVVGALPTGPVWAVNVASRIVWFDHRTGTLISGPASGSAEVFSSIDLNRDGTLISPPRELAELGEEAVRLPNLVPRGELRGYLAQILAVGDEVKPARVSEKAEPAVAKKQEEPARAAQKEETETAVVGLPHRAPWYAEHGMLGEFTLRGVEEWTPEDAAEHARKVSDAFAVPGLRDEVVKRVTDMLVARDLDDWRTWLERGQHFALNDGRVVWLRPELHQLQPLAEASAKDKVRNYTVRFASTSLTVESAQEHVRATDLAIFTAVQLAGVAASTAVAGVQVSGHAARSTMWGAKQNVISGRKLFVDDSNGFVSELRFRLSVDGAAQVPAEAVSVPRQVMVEFPKAFSGSAEPRVALEPLPATFTGGPAVGRSVAALGARRHRLGGEVLNGLDLRGLVDALTGALLRAGVPGKTTVEVIKESMTWLTEPAVRNRSRWWLTSGDVSTAIVKGVNLPGLEGFRGHFRATADFSDLEAIGPTDFSTREDLGTGLSVVQQRGGKSNATVTAVANLTGIAAPSVAHPQAKGMLPFVTLSYTSGSKWSRTLTTQTLSHTILKAQEVMARYRATAVLSLEWTSTSHPRLGTVQAQAHGEVSVPWRGGEGARAFEEAVLGEVRSPELLAQEAAAALPAVAQPHVRLLLRAAGLQTSMVRAERTAAQVQELRQKGSEVQGSQSVPLPLALAAYRGAGFAVAAALPGAELVEVFLRALLRDAAAGQRKVKWSAVDGQLASFFGRPALEGEVADLLAGVHHDVQVGGRVFRLKVRGHLLAHRGTDTYDMTVNKRAALGETVAGSVEHGHLAQFAFGAAARFQVSPETRMQFGALRLQGAYGVAKGRAFTSVAKSYRRMENVGAVDEHRYDVLYEVSIAPVERPQKALKFWLDDPGNLLAQVVVARAHAPAEPVSREERLEAGTVRYMRSWPQGEPQFDFAKGAAGLYPAFLSTDQLMKLAGGLYSAIHRIPLGADREEAWPTQLTNAFLPSALASFFGHLTDPNGLVVGFPEVAGQQSAMTVRVRGYKPRPVEKFAKDQPTEIEQYSQGQAVHSNTTATEWAVGGAAALGLQARYGSDSGNEVTMVDPQEESAEQHGDAHQETAGGRHVSQVVADGRYVGSASEENSEGGIDISRVTYPEGEPFRADAVWEITMHRWKEGHEDMAQTTTRLVHIASGMDMLVPERRIEDVMPAQAAPSGTAQASEDAVASKPEVRHGYMGGSLQVSATHAEALQAGGVFQHIVDTLKDRGVLSRRDVPTALRTALLAAFRSDSLEKKWSQLLSDGVSGWFPFSGNESSSLSGLGGGTRYLWVSVKAVGMAPATESRDRPKDKLTLRGEEVQEEKEKKSVGHGFRVGFNVTGRGGAHEKDGDHGHAGGDLNVSRFWLALRGITEKLKILDIVRSSPKGPSVEFSHEVAFQVEMRLATKAPEILSAPGGLAVAIGRAVTALGAWLPMRAPQPERAWFAKQSWTWTHTSEPNSLSGQARLLTPRAMTVAAAGPDKQPLRQAITSSLRWDPAWHPDGERAASVTEAVPSDIHPWDIPAAAVVRQWAKAVAAAGGKRGVDPLHLGREVTALGIGTDAGWTYDQQTRMTALRVGIKQLLAHTYDIHVAGRKVTVGFELTSARRWSEADHAAKNRQYRQADEDREAGFLRVGGTVRGLGPDAGGGVTDAAVQGRTAFDEGKAGEQKVERGVSETIETNAEANRSYAVFDFDVRVHLSNAGRNGRLTIDVPTGLTASLPLNDEGEVDSEVRTKLGHLFAVQEDESAQSPKTPLPRKPVPASVPGQDDAPTVPATSVEAARRRQIREGKRAEPAVPETVPETGDIAVFVEAVLTEPALQGLRPEAVARAFAIQERVNPGRTLIGTDPETQAMREQRRHHLAEITRALVDGGQQAAEEKAEKFATGKTRPGLYGRGRRDELAAHAQRQESGPVLLAPGFDVWGRHGEEQQGREIVDSDLTDRMRRWLERPATMDRPVRVKDLVGLQYTGQPHWTPETLVKVGSLNLSYADRARLVMRVPGLNDQLAAALSKRLDDTAPAGVRVLVQPGYASGDQFGIAAALIGDPKLHVVLVSDVAGRKDSSDAIAEFYRSSGIPSSRVHRVAADGQAAFEASRKKVNRIFDDLSPGLSHAQKLEHTLQVRDGTKWIARNFTVGVRRAIRRAWRVDDSGFPSATQAAVADWLRRKGALPSKTQDTIVLWSRFSGKSGHAHAEHDTSYEGMRQILRGLATKAKAQGEQPLVVIAGDAYADPRHKNKYRDIVQEAHKAGLNVRDLTNFWKADKAFLQSWGGNDRVGQFKVYEYLHRYSRSTRHLGFRSGNLESLALMGHTVMYMEDRDHTSSWRMEQWHAARNSLLTTHGALATGYERITVDELPTRTGKVMNKLRDIEAKMKLDDPGRQNLPSHKNPPWIFGASRREPKPSKYFTNVGKGFFPNDLLKITDYLLPQAPNAAPAAAVHARQGDGGQPQFAVIPDAPAQFDAGELLNHEVAKWADTELRWEAEVERVSAQLAVAQRHALTASRQAEAADQQVTESRRLATHWNKTLQQATADQEAAKRKLAAVQRETARLVRLEQSGAAPLWQVQNQRAVARQQALVAERAQQAADDLASDAAQQQWLAEQQAEAEERVAQRAVEAQEAAERRVAVTQLAADRAAEAHRAARTQRREAEAQRREAEAQRREARRREAERLEAEAQRREVERREARRREAERLEAEAQRREAERREARRREAERLEAEARRREAERLEAEAQRREAQRRAAAHAPVHADGDFSDTDEVEDVLADDDSFVVKEKFPDERIRWALSQFHSDTTTEPQPTAGFGKSRFGLRPDKLRVSRTETYRTLFFRKDNEPLFRYDTRHFDTIFNEGFRPWNNKAPRSLLHYQSHLQRTAMVSASRSAGTFLPPWAVAPDGTANLYVIKAPGGVDMVASLRRRAWWMMYEVAFWKGIRPEFIDRVEIVRKVPGQKKPQVVRVITRRDWEKEFEHQGKTLQDGSWRGPNGLKLTAEANELASDLRESAYRLEPRITVQLRSCMRKIDNLKLASDVKSEHSLKRKLATQLHQNPALAAQDAVLNFGDALRYTVKVTKDGKYTKRVGEVAAELRRRGYTLLYYRNSWGSSGYQGINSVWRDVVNGVNFEVQFHTARSVDAREAAHSLYEKVRIPGVSREDLAANLKEQEKIFRRVPVPDGASSVRL
ncbi:hypothetical protein ACIP98_39225 [Streptomyces sp. NPDC088354]|uniref:scabin-related ADP-ribosyltransferase n=1 Tax=Streptomyces sp. NPDC088354 TaxID=3365856 RepID=UPI003820F45A